MEMAAKRSQVVQSGRYFRNLVACRDKGCAEHGFEEGYEEGGLCPPPVAAFNGSKAFLSQMKICHNVSRYSHDKLNLPEYHCTQLHSDSSVLLL